MRSDFLLLLIAVALPCATFAQASESGADLKEIQQLETDLLTSARTTDPKILDHILADDYVNLTPTGTGPGKSAILANFNEHKGAAPPYSVHQREMHFYRLDSTTVVAAYIKEYVAHENKNVARQDATDIFVRDGSAWRLKLTRTSPHAEAPTN